MPRQGLVIDERCMTELAIWKTVVDLRFGAAIYSAHADPLHTAEKVYARTDRVARG